MSSGGGFTVCRELVRGLAEERPGWRFTVAMTDGSSYHEPMRRERFASNVSLLWAPANTCALGRRIWYENTTLVNWAKAHGVGAVLQLNGQKIPRLRLPTISHAQDPVPFLPHMWSTGRRAAFGAWLRRRAVRQALMHADVMGFTSGYLRDLICGWDKVTPRRAEVFYNAVPQDWFSREDSQMPALSARPMCVLTVSDVTRHKRQDLVARAVCALRKERGFEKLEYRIVGRVFDEGYAEGIRELSRRTGAEVGATKPVVELVGRLSGDELAAEFKNARCFAFMSVCESFGIPPLEAMSFGTPVISSDCCAMPEVLGKAAAFVRADDEEGLKETLKRVLTKDGLAADMRARGFERFRTFTWGETVRKMAGCFGEMVGEFGARSAELTMRERRTGQVD